jgi:hypothetical protein
MVRPLEEVFSKVIASDAYPYGYGAVRDFLAEPYGPGTADWVITNPPFRLAEAFIDRSLGVARGGVAILARTQFVEGVGRFERLFRERPPAVFAPFTERVPMVRGRLDQSASTATSYAWFVWHKDQRVPVWRTKLIPPCRKQLERAGDYPTQLQSQSSGSGEDGTFSSSAVQAGQLSLF